MRALIVGSLLSLTVSAGAEPFGQPSAPAPRPLPARTVAAPLTVAAPEASTTVDGKKEAREVARAYGVDDAFKIEALAFVFDIRQDDRVIHREWIWDIADNRVSYQGNGPTGLPIELTYRRDRMLDGDAELNRSVDALFIQDQFWLLFPFHLVWERGLNTRLASRVRPPISPIDAACLSMTYPPGRPDAGDRYDLYLGPDHLIQEWAYTPRGAAEPEMATTWERSAKAGPFLFSMAHRSADGKTVAWFERISVKIADRGWVDAVPLEQEVSQNSTEPAPRQAL